MSKNGNSCLKSVYELISDHFQVEFNYLIGINFCGYKFLRSVLIAFCGYLFLQTQLFPKEMRVFIFANFIFSKKMYEFKLI